METERESRSAFSKQDYRDQASFRVALRIFLHFSEEQARAHGITPNQHLLLLLARGHPSYPGVSIGELARSLRLLPSTASALVDRAVERGLLRRREDPADRRRALVSLTEQGQRILDAIMRANRREMRTLEGALFNESLVDALRASSEARDAEQSPGSRSHSDSGHPRNQPVR